jgi:mRNA interferase MazF
VALPWSPERRDIVWMDCHPQSGREMKDLHPMLVLSPRVFNERTGIVIGLPMTSAESNDDNPFAVKVVGPRDVPSYILCHQPKSYDWHARKAKPHPWKQVSEKIFFEACARLNQIVALCE